MYIYIYIYIQYIYIYVYIYLYTFQVLVKVFIKVFTSSKFILTLATKLTSTISSTLYDILLKLAKRCFCCIFGSMFPAYLRLQAQFYKLNTEPLPPEILGGGRGRRH
jgi:hypothetical protein